MAITYIFFLKWSMVVAADDILGRVSPDCKWNPAFWRTGKWFKEQTEHSALLAPEVVPDFLEASLVSLPQQEIDNPFLLPIHWMKRKTQNHQNDEQNEEWTKEERKTWLPFKAGVGIRWGGFELDERKVLCMYACLNACMYVFLRWGKCCRQRNALVLRLLLYKFWQRNTLV